MASTLEPSVFFANLAPNPEDRKVLIAKLKMTLFGPKPSTVYVSGPRNTGKTMLISLIQKITGMISLLLPSPWVWLTNDFIWLRGTQGYNYTLSFGSETFKMRKVFVICADEFPLVKGNPQIDIVLDQVFDSQAQPIDLSNYKDYENYIKNY